MRPLLSASPRQSPLETFVEPRVHAILGQASVESAHGVTVRVGVAEEDFERAFGFLRHDISRRNGLVKLYGRFWGRT